MSDVFLFIPDIGKLCLVSFSLISLARHFSILFIYFPNYLLLISVIFLYCVHYWEACCRLFWGTFSGWSHPSKLFVCLFVFSNHSYDLPCCKWWALFLWSFPLSLGRGKFPWDGSAVGEEQVGRTQGGEQEGQIDWLYFSSDVQCKSLCQDLKDCHKISQLTAIR